MSELNLSILCSNSSCDWWNFTDKNRCFMSHGFSRDIIEDCIRLHLKQKIEKPPKSVMDIMGLEIE